MSLLTQHGNSALMLAAKKSRTDIVSLLLEAGAYIDLQNEVILVGECMAFWRAHNECMCTSHPSLFTTCTLEQRRLKRGTASVRHRRAQRMPPNGREFSCWLDSHGHDRQRVKVLFQIKRSS